MRGIEVRRDDTSKWVKKVQREMLDLLADAPDAGQLVDQLPRVHALLQARLSALRQRKIPLVELLISQKLSRSLEEYKVPSPAAKAAAQLATIDKNLIPGQRVRFLYTRGKPGVFAWDLEERPDPKTVDIDRYAELL